jgi:hypothetical protein
MTYAERFTRLQNDPSVSYWLKDALHALDRRDPVDAESDAALLAEMMAQRAAELLNPAPRHSADCAERGRPRGNKVITDL